MTDSRFYSRFYREPATASHACGVSGKIRVDALAHLVIAEVIRDYLQLPY